MSQLKKVLVSESKPLSAGAVLTYNISVFDTIDDILLEFLNSNAPATKANMLAGIGKVLLNINGEQVINVPLARLVDVYTSLGTQVGQNIVNVIGLNVSRYLFKNPSDEDYFAFGNYIDANNKVNTIQLQIFCNGTITGLTDCNVTTVRRGTNQLLGAYIKVIDYPQTMSSTGTSVVDTLPRDSDEAYMCILAHNGGGVISTGECVVNGANVYDVTSQSVDDYIVSARGLAPVSGSFNYSFSDGSVRGILPMQGVTELRLKTTFTTAPTSGTYDLTAVSIRNVPQAMLNAVAA